MLAFKHTQSTYFLYISHTGSERNVDSKDKFDLGNFDNKRGKLAGDDDERADDDCIGASGVGLVDDDDERPDDDCIGTSRVGLVDDDDERADNIGRSTAVVDAADDDDDECAVEDGNAEHSLAAVH